MSESRKNNALIRLLSHRILFALHLFTYCAVMGLLVLIWAVTGDGLFWPFFAIFGWGFASGFHTLVYLMYNDKIEVLSKIRHDPTFKVLFVFHAWFYITVNLFLLIINLAFAPGVIFFIYPLMYWGIAFAFHALGFFLWDSSLNRELKNLKVKYPDEGDKKLKMRAASKISNFWLVIIHISYYIVVNIWLYTNNILRPSDPTELIEASLAWGSILIVHIFSYLLFYFVESITPVMKGLIINIAFYIVGNGWQLYQYFTNPSKIFWPIFSLLLWGILIAYHAYITMNWNSIIDKALNTVKSQYGEDLDKYKLRSKARWLVFWMW
ncbi:MAG: 2TM domain-containing protein, partial [Promethearchaeota archaeon]